MLTITEMGKTPTSAVKVGTHVIVMLVDEKVANAGRAVVPVTQVVRVVVRPSASVIVPRAVCAMHPREIVRSVKVPERVGGVSP